MPDRTTPGTMPDPYHSVLASTTPPRIWNFYPTLQAAQAAQPSTFFASNAFAGVYLPMTYEQYKAAERSYDLSDPLREINAQTYHEMLDVLPPLHSRQQGGLTTFLMSEFFSGSYTHQYAAYRGRYYCRLVDVLDQSTWMTADEIDAQRHYPTHGATGRLLEERTP